MINATSVKPIPLIILIQGLWLMVDWFYKELPNEPNPISLGFQGISLANENLKIVKFKKLVNR
jgi:hypothetical protein